MFAQALEILSANRDILDVAATRLLEVETLDEAALRELTRDLRRAAASSVAPISSDMGAPCVLASLASRTPEMRNRHRRSH